jgi:PIN domain nuclease of toxin-antitoxin system
VSVAHGHLAGLLPGDHRDPFDRVLAAQSMLERIEVVSNDEALARFGAKVVW